MKSSSWTTSAVAEVKAGAAVSLSIGDDLSMGTFSSDDDMVKMGVIESRPGGEK
jgi:hypothetical protein